MNTAEWALAIAITSIVVNAIDIAIMFRRYRRERDAGTIVARAKGTIKRGDAVVFGDEERFK